MKSSTLVLPSIAKVSSWHYLLVTLFIEFAWYVLIAFGCKLVCCVVAHSRQRLDHRLGRCGFWRGRQGSCLLGGSLDLLQLWCTYSLPWQLLVLLLRGACKLWTLRYARSLILWWSPTFSANWLFGSTYRGGENFVSRIVAPRGV